MVLIDGFQPEGITKLIKDSVFMMPHLGVLSTVDYEAASEVFRKDCMIQLGTCVAPRGIPRADSHEVMKVEFDMPDGTHIEERVGSGEIRRVSLAEGYTVDAKISPNRGYDIGAGSGHALPVRIEGGVVGVILDGRGRPLTLPNDRAAAKQALLRWYRALSMYPPEVLDSYTEVHS
jgi:hypothetical protein